MEKRLRRGIKLTGLFLQYLITNLVMIGYYSIKGIISAPVIGKIGIIFTYVGVVLLAIFKRVIFWGVLGLVLIVAMALSVWMTKDDEDKLDCISNMTQKTAGKKTRNPYFEGMDAKTAKIEYKRLLKIYHPDNESGDMEQTQAVIIAYNQYCLEHGCR